jgi:hypothetical protein
LTVVGEQGSGKSTAARLIRRLVDPHQADLRAEPRQIDDIMIAASRSRIVALDNLSHLSPWLSDALCRLSTGGALTKRELYSDDNETIIEATRPVIITSIGDVITRGDLIDRAITITMPAMSDSDRRQEADIWQTFERLSPAILGVLLDGVGRALASQDRTVVSNLPRMADWAVWSSAAESALGWSGRAIVDAYRTMRDTVVESNLDGDAFAIALRSVPRPYEGTATELLERLTPATRKTPRGWPDSPRALGVALRRLAPALRAVGIQFTPGRAGHSGRRLIILEDLAPRPSASSAPSATPARAGILSFDGDASGVADDRADDHGQQVSAAVARLHGAADAADVADSAKHAGSEVEDNGGRHY